MTRYSPTTVLLLGLVITLGAVALYSRYITSQISRVQKLQTDLVDRNRRDSLQLIRIQDDLNSVAHAMRDMLDGGTSYPLTAWQAQFDRLEADLADALRLQGEAAVTHRLPEQQDYLRDSMTQFWDAMDRMFALARDGQEAEALREVRNQLQARQAALTATVARLLVQNNESEEEAAAEIGSVYAEVNRQVLLFLLATLAAILSTGVYQIRSNRRVFAELSRLSAQRSELARALISSQESTLRHVSRDLHDEFGQVLTAIGSLLDRTRRSLPQASPAREDLEEVRQIAQSTLDSVRSMSQALHPAVLEEGGLESALDWLISTTRQRAGLEIRYEKSGDAWPVDADRGIHIYRVLQEALNNVSRHAGVKEAVVRLAFSPRMLALDVEDRGRGFPNGGTGRGIGLVGMRERAELLGGTVEFRTPPGGGTEVCLSVPREGLGPEIDPMTDERKAGEREVAGS
jgi:signal transduction histidine kinase